METPLITQSKEFVRKPYVVNALEITLENIERVAPMIGKLHRKRNGSPWIEVDRQKVPVVTKVYPGFFMTVQGDSVRCYSPRTFLAQFTENSQEIQAWVDWMNSAGSSDGATQLV